MGGEGPRYHAGPSADYVEVLRQRLSMTHQQMTAPPPPASANPYQEGSLIFVMTTPPERTNKLTPRWKGPFRVKRVPNPYQVVYEDGSAWRTIHTNHAKPAKLTAPDLPLLTPAPEPPRPTLGYLPRSHKDLALIHLLLLFKQPYLPGAPLLLPQHQYPRRLPPHLPRMRGLPAISRQPRGIRPPLRNSPRIL